MKVKPYPKTKPSGIEWLGNVPEHWEVKRLRWIGDAIIGLTYSPSDVVGEGEGSLVLRSSNIQNGRIVLSDNVFVSSEIPEKLRTRVGDILICTRNGSRDLVGKSGRIREMESGLTFGAFTAVYRSRSNDYMFYVFNSGLFSFQSGLFQTSTIFQLTNGTINTFQIPLPPPAEQTAIAAYLDRETGRIDELVEKKRTLIERLKEKRSALISACVTRGLPSGAGKKYPRIVQIYAEELQKSNQPRPSAFPADQLPENPPLNPSGIEWLGDVPAHWEVAQLRRKAQILDCKHRTVPFIDDGIPLASIREVHGFEVDLTKAKQTTEEEFLALTEGDRRPRTGDIIYSRNATVGDAALVTTTEKFCMGQDVCLIRAPKHRPKYLLYLLRSNPLMEQVESLVIGSTFRRINVGQIHAFWICVPPLPEQAAIAAYLDLETAKIDALVAKVETAIERLQEFRSALISAAVTGKIDVREEAGLSIEGRDR